MINAVPKSFTLHARGGTLSEVSHGAALADIDLAARSRAGAALRGDCLAGSGQFPRALAALDMVAEPVPSLGVGAGGPRRAEDQGGDFCRGRTQGAEIP